ncbi:MAG: hypothetical protein ABI988_12890, partial [Nitrospirota bacterium]
MTAWTGITSSTLSLINTAEGEVFGGFALSQVREVAPYMNMSLFAWGNTVDQEIAAIGVCLSQDIRKSIRFKQTKITPIGKTQAKALTQVMKVSVLPYNGKRQVFKMRATPPEIETSAHQQTPTIIGPVQKFQKPIPPDARSVSQAVIPFGGQPFAIANQSQSALQLPDNETFRINRATALALHDGNCASGCP